MRQTAILIMIIICGVAGAMEMLPGDGARVTVYGIEAEMIESIDSATIYMPEKDGMYTIYEFPGCTKDRLLDDIFTHNITQRKCNNNNYPEILDSIKSYINNSAEIDTLSYNTYELIKYTPTDLPITKKTPGEYWTEQYQNLHALVVLYIKDEIELLWIGLDYAEYKNFRIKCRILKLLDNSTI